MDPNALMSYKPFDISGVAQDVQVLSDEAVLPLCSPSFLANMYGC